MSELNSSGKDILALVLGVLAIFLIFRVIFDDDDNEIVSKKGKEYLSDNEKMKNVRKTLQGLDSSEEPYQEVIIQPD